MFNKRLIIFCLAMARIVRTRNFVKHFYPLTFFPASLSRILTDFARKEKCSLSRIPFRMSDKTSPCASRVSIFNPPDHTRHCSNTVLVLLQWPDCTLSRLGKLTLTRPTGDPVDSDPIVWMIRTDGLIPRDLAIPHETLTVFTHLACSQNAYCGHFA